MGKVSETELQGISQKSCRVLNKLGSQIQWVNSYVTDNTIYCIYSALTRGWSGVMPSRADFP